MKVTTIEAGAFKESGTVVLTVRLDFRDVNVQRDAEDFHYQAGEQDVEKEESFAIVMQ